MNEETRARYAAYFKEHVATVVESNNLFEVIDWRNRNGSIEYYIRFIVDIIQGTLIIQGDLGNCIACWHHTTLPEKLRDYVDDIGYFIEKFQCASDDYTYCYHDVLDDFSSVKEEYLERFPEDPEVKETLDEILGLLDQYSDEYETSGIYDSKVTDAFYRLDCNWWDHGLRRLGRRVAPRVYLWAIGYQMAIDQIRLEKSKSQTECKA